MIKTLLLITTSILVSACRGDKFEKVGLNEQIGKKDTIAIYWEPIQFDTIKASIKDLITFPGDDTLKYLPSDRDLMLKFEFSGKMKEYMKHGNMIVRPYDSSVFVQRINSTSFKLKVNQPIDDWKIAMYYEFTFVKPYYFSYILDSTTRRINPNDTISLLVRAAMTKPGVPWDY